VAKKTKLSKVKHANTVNGNVIQAILKVFALTLVPVLFTTLFMIIKEKIDDQITRISI
jgi:hypothetical protein